MRHGARTLLALAGVAAVVAAALSVTAALRRWKPAPATALGASIIEVEAGRKTTPLIGAPTATGEYEVTFVARASAGIPPRIVSDVTGWGEQPGEGFSFDVGRMTRVAGTKGDDGTERDPWYSLVARVAPGARIEYLVAYAPGDYRVDPHNPRRARFRGDSLASEFVTPGYVPPPDTEGARMAPPAGQAVEATVESRALSGPVEVVVYTPPGYSGNRRYPVAVFHDRLNWGREGEGPRLLDWLIAHGRIEPVVAAFAASGRPGDENVPAVRAFLTAELPRWLASRYRVTRNAGERAVLGVSYGAKDALEAATGAGAAYGRVGLLIPGRRLQPADIQTLAARPADHLRIGILAGRYDAPNLPAARGARQAFTAGHAVHYVEVPEGHNAATWRDHAGEILAVLFPVGSHGRR